MFTDLVNFFNIVFPCEKHGFSNFYYLCRCPDKTDKKRYDNFLAISVMNQETCNEQCLAESRVTPLTQLPPLENLFRLYDMPCFYRGELVACCGKAKSGKTLFLSVLMACALKSKVLALERCSEAPMTVLWIDTEQSPQSTQDILINRVMPLAGVKEVSDDDFFVFNLRGLGYEKRRQLMDLAITRVKPDLVIIDGIKDLMTDINDATQATLIIEHVMSLAQQCNCCIVNVLHQNKSADDNNMRGSIGTELTNKAFEVYSCSYYEDWETFKVKQTTSRRVHIKQTLYYKLDDQGIPQAASAVSDQPRDAHGRWVSSKSNTEDLRKLFVNFMENRSQRSYGELMGVAMRKFGVPDAKTYYALFKDAVELGVIRTQVKPGTSAQWVELMDNKLPF